MLVWIENAPKYEMNTEDEVIQYVDTFLTCNSEDPEIAELAELQIHKHSRTCRKKGKALCRFGFLYHRFLELCCCIPLMKMLKNTGKNIYKCKRQ